MMVPSAGASVPERRFTPVDAGCELCGARDFAPLWELSKRVRTRSFVYLFEHHVGACRRCGFVYAVPGYRDDELAGYYADSFPNWLGVPSHSWDERLAFIGRHARNGGRFLEIGGNNDRVTVDRLTQAGFHVRRFDHNNAAPRDYATLDAVPSGGIDVVAHYYTLEHAANGPAFLQACLRMLVPGGVMICEVPDLDRYSLDPAEQLGAVEHVRHFTGTTLTRMAQQAGFEVLELSYAQVSKSGGFAAAFRNAAAVPASPEFVAAATRIGEGASLIAAFAHQVDALAAIVNVRATPEHPVVVWGANPITSELIERLDVAVGRVLVLDDDPLKRDYFTTVKVYRPEEAVDELRRAAFMVSSRRHLTARFLARARELTGDVVGSESVAVMDHGVCEFDPDALGTRRSK